MSKAKKQKRMRDTIANAKPITYKKGDAAWKEARNTRRKRRIAIVKRVRVLNKRRAQEEK